MAFTLTFTTLVALASFSGSAFAAPAINGENLAARADCVKTVYSKAGDNCDTLGAQNGLTGTDIKNANTFLNCDDIWVNTPICIVASTTTPTCSSTYYSKAGETCDSLATKFGVSSDAIHAANAFLTCNDIWANTPICVPAGGSPTCVSTYTSVAGDTCATLDSKFGFSSGAIKTANAFLNCNDIWANTPICVPPGGSSNGGSNNGGSTTTDCVMTYISEAGDTCNSLATDFGLTASAIQNANSFLNCNDIWTNTAICVPSGGRVSRPQAGSASECVVTYYSTAGDNCDNIGNKFGLEDWEIQNANSFVNCNDIWSGTAICVVSGC